MRILIDTNVLISALVFGGRPREAIVRAMEDGHTLIVTSYIEREFREKLLQKWPGRAEAVFTAYCGAGLLRLDSAEEICGALRDPKDLPVLSDAIHYGVDAILSGDRDFLEAGLDRPAVLSASMLLDRLDRCDPDI